MRACSLELVGLGFRVKDKVRSLLGIGLVLGLAVVLGLTYFTCPTSSPQKPAQPHFTHTRPSMLWSCLRKASVIFIKVHENRWQNFDYRMPQVIWEDASLT